MSAETATEKPSTLKKIPFHLQSSQTRLLIKNGTVVNANKIEVVQIYIEDGIIKQIGKNLVIPGGTRVIDARNMLVLPGGIDPHTHFEFEFMGEKSVDDFYIGTKAAIVGGTTTIIDFAIPKKGESLISCYEKYRKMADGKVCCDYGLHVGITWWSDQVKKEIEQLCEEHGVNSFKIFLAYKDVYMVSDEEMYSIFETCKSIGALAMVHAENGTLIKENTKRLLQSGVTGPEGHELSRPEEIEAEAVFRACVFANQVKCPLYITRVTSVASANVIQERKTKCQVVLGATSVSSIGGHGNISANNSPLLITSPPIRSNPSIFLHLIQLLSSGDLQVVGSDNCTFTTKQKEHGLGDFSKIPNGVNGVEDRMSVVWEKGVCSGILTPQQFVAVTSTNAAKIFNMYPKKGCIAVGSDADIVVWNPRKTRTISAKTHHQATDYNIFEGLVCHGVAEYVIVKGRVCIEEGQIKPVLSRGYGKFISTPVNAPFVYKDMGKDQDGQEMETDDRKGMNGVGYDIGDLAVSVRDSNSDERSSIYSIPGSPVSQRSGRAMRRTGQRDLHSSTFSVASDRSDDSKKTSIRITEPPGGRSTGFW